MAMAQRNGDASEIDASTIETIVREVLARLGGSPIKSAAQNGAIAAREKPQAAATAGSVVHLSDRVISLATLKGKLDGRRVISVDRGTIVTPMAKDFLRESGVSIRIAGAAQRGSSASSVRLVLGVAETSFEPAALVARLSAAVEQVARIGLVGVVDELSARVRLGGERGVLLTGEPEAALCLANRASGVRAARAGCVASVRAGREAIGANLLVIDPAGKSGHEIERIVAEFCRGSCDCPEKFRSKLG